MLRSMKVLLRSQTKTGSDEASGATKGALLRKRVLPARQLKGCPFSPVIVDLRLDNRTHGKAATDILVAVQGISCSALGVGPAYSGYDSPPTGGDANRQDGGHCLSETVPLFQMGGPHQAGLLRTIGAVWEPSRKSRYSCVIAGVATSTISRFSSQNSMT